METKAFPIRAQTEAQPPPSRITSISFRLDRTEPEQLGWDLNHPYVETFWLPTIGPTSCEISLADNGKFHGCQQVDISSADTFPAAILRSCDFHWCPGMPRG